MNIRTIAIVLGDNDFQNTFVSLLENLVGVIEYHEGSRDVLQKEDIEKIIYEGIRFHYLAFQRLDTLRYNNPELDHTLDYLKKGIKIYFDDEAEKIISENDYGGAWYLEVMTGKVHYF